MWGWGIPAEDRGKGTGVATGDLTQCREVKTADPKLSLPYVGLAPAILPHTHRRKSSWELFEDMGEEKGFWPLG